jgi:hypothetical protein
MADEVWFARLAAVTGSASEDRAPAHLKSKVYSLLVTSMAQSGPLLDLRDVKHAGGHLCVFEEAVAMLPAGAAVGSMNPCRVCHARLLGERMEHAPIFWPGCPYSEFHKVRSG